MPDTDLPVMIFLCIKDLQRVEKNLLYMNMSAFLFPFYQIQYLSRSVMCDFNCVQPTAFWFLLYIILATVIERICDMFFLEILPLHVHHLDINFLEMEYYVI